MDTHTKRLKFIYENKEFTTDVGRSISIERFVEQLKVHFDIEPDISLNFINIRTNIGLAPGSISDFWVGDNQIPIYKIEIRKSDENTYSQKWCRKFFNSYVIPFFIQICDFCVNVLAGVVASAVFIEDRNLLKKRIGVFLIVVIIIKLVFDRFFRKFIRNQCAQVLNDPRPAPSMPNGAQPI
ncbi:unnamed protein product [Adineta steineri]|uniref:Uncharacterized protein n=1 Tax=Adineta steineri TaxID=433720 RepID=A0A819EYX8_9BILA|nr:unnamed protein product [Adineta steineri]CAF3858630.1 unnamed protein product [Adineta steineri]